MELDIDLAQKTSLDDLPDKTKDQMFTGFHNILRPNVNHRAPNRLGRVDDNVVVFDHLELIDGLLGLATNVQYTFIDRIRHRIVDQFTQNETVYCNRAQKIGLISLTTSFCFRCLTSAFIE